VRLTDFWARLDQVFGSAYASSVARDQVLAQLGGRTIVEALDAGEKAADVWRAVVAAYPDRVPARLR
jgi:phosphatidate phosphatase APP1